MSVWVWVLGSQPCVWRGRKRWLGESNQPSSSFLDPLHPPAPTPAPLHPLYPQPGLSPTRTYSHG